MKGKILIGVLLLLSACFEDMVTMDQRLKKEVKAIDDYLAANGINAIKDASGIRVVVTQLGDAGLPPNYENFVKVKYTGKLFSTGTVFEDASTPNDKKLGNFIVGWQIGLAMLPEGSKATLYIPSGYAYGNTAVGNIPANSTLVFNVELEEVTPTTAQINQLEDDIETLDEYLADNEIEGVIEHESGMRYVITHEGSGPSPASIYTQVKLDYVGKAIGSTTPFLDRILEPNADFSSRLVNFPHGLLIGLQFLQKGDKATFYVPSGLAFGSQAVTDPNTGATVIPGNSNIIFTIELLDVLP